ncbi:Beta-barrel assembly machine subunit BamD [Fibrobacter intestinalis]|uniref:Beta-barrel assembly machine subunit BamD n=1 Tax=Fibrobacter intestinalis TaxID=28122 RepID=A0A1M6SS40_9BACT|nr:MULTISPECIES: outer membrane protein assembly factor BamD [Fibrobacter]MDD7297872.1 outer membrane protein assembly factor BamD [Fibrobacter intestinalis]PBC68545.1 Beta-barrel assembly machine subunit BamD [Fibrobacter sp. UWS1]PBC73811.1 Beta-barrel assembly machine subunit BamD [Fibrobacter sp. NR9]SHK47450.1 Beta-barrel assembly machine subunit BamD [Fibrobacter intestinalis]SJZ41492.1 Beta-barrel assembly machine subunit BamD [Fibrobacter intestinalis]
MRTNKYISLLGFFAIFAFLFSACAPEGGGDRTQMCKNRFDSADKDFKAGRYGRVKEPLEEILNLCIGTGYMEQTQFLLAESYFNLEEWLEARGEYGSFINNFPSSPFIETAEFRKAVSSFNIEYNIDRDETNTTLAMKDFEKFISNYPESPLLDSVNHYMLLLLERRAERDFRTARLYRKLGHPQSTVIYMKEFLDLFPQSKRRPEALYLLVESYAELDQFESARYYLENYRTTVPDSIQKRLESVESQEKYIAKLEKKFQKRIQKEQAEKLLAKKEAKEEADAHPDDEEEDDDE